MTWQETRRHIFESGQPRAAAAIARAIAVGILKPARGQNCVDCGAPAVEYDHRDYNKPLVVEPVCRSCNVLRGKAVPADPPVVLPETKYLDAHEVIRFFGSFADTAKHMGVTRQTIYNWFFYRDLPTCRAEQAERLSRGVLRPRLYRYWELSHS